MRHTASLVATLAIITGCSKHADAPIHLERGASTPTAVSNDAGAPDPATTAGAATGAGTPDAATPDAATTDAATMDAGTDAGSIPLPDEPWFHDKPEAYEDCVAPLVKTPTPHLAPPFERCDPRSQVVNPQVGGSAHFHYRSFSAQRTNARRASSPGVCCYLIFEFPRHGP